MSKINAEYSAEHYFAALKLIEQLYKDGLISAQRVNLQLQFIKFLVILPFTFQLSLHLERGTHHAY